MSTEKTPDQGAGPSAGTAGTIELGGGLPVKRLGFGAMRLPGISQLEVGSGVFVPFRDALVSAIKVLRDLDMPPDEVDAIVAAHHPLIVHRVMELHRERLEERLADQLRTLDRLERILTPAFSRLPPVPSKRPSSAGTRSLHGSEVDPAITASRHHKVRSVDTRLDLVDREPHQTERSADERRHVRPHR